MVYRARWLDLWNWRRNDEFIWVHHFIVEVEGTAIGVCQYYDYALGGETWHNRADVKEAYSINYMNMIGEEKDVYFYKLP